ncbi:hypothetical protein BC939DRAFT_500358 [Gamsiella multidivaricata]|uniref:uncharacterized protein n=1 Tax=Gamsiella multidivaricata TaxID=101098 RepID=UPI00221FDD85|nr:uncharacterized protein BC939DRAFT_500358 [Gamsiella multidivaricata]KAI7828904.1 hypothetical protein BC939DRAFT_500358 [Gamsiella multidivaricata]
MDQFRLCFLRECGCHIHLAKHEEYNMERPMEFFYEYGPYVANVLKIIKYVFMAAPVADHVEHIQKILEKKGQGMATLVDNAITAIEQSAGASHGGVDTNTGIASLGKLEPLQGHYLRQLKSYLGVHDNSSALNNLEWIVVEGHVKWDCSDHRFNYSELLQ